MFQLYDASLLRHAPSLDATSRPSLGGRYLTAHHRAPDLRPFPAGSTAHVTPLAIFSAFVSLQAGKTLPPRALSRTEPRPLSRAVATPGHFGTNLAHSVPLLWNPCGYNHPNRRLIHVLQKFHMQYSTPVPSFSTGLPHVLTPNHAASPPILC